MTIIDDDNFICNQEKEIFYPKIWDLTFEKKYSRWIPGPKNNWPLCKYYHIGETRGYETEAARAYFATTEKLISKTELVDELVGSGISTKIRLGWELYKLEQFYRKYVDEYGYPREEYKSELSKPIDELLADHGIEVLSPLIQVRICWQNFFF